MFRTFSFFYVRFKHFPRNPVVLRYFLSAKKLRVLHIFSAMYAIPSRTEDMCTVTSVLLHVTLPKLLIKLR
jgi:hypothetical protein